MALRKTISQNELRESREQRGIDDSKHARGYSGSRGGWTQPVEQPKPDKRR